MDPRRKHVNIFNLYLTGPPRVTNLHAEDVHDDSFIVAWERSRGVRPDEYRIYISPHDNTSVLLPIKIETYTEYEFQGLKNFTEYYVTVISVEDGMESIGVSLKVITGVPVRQQSEETRGKFTLTK